MRLYRVTFSYEAGVSAGFAFYASKREARKAAADWRRDHASDASAGFAVLDFKPTRGGVLELLRSIADHPDNG